VRNLSSNIEIEHVQAYSTIEVRERAGSPDSFYVRAGKRLLDLVIVVPLIVAVSPLVLILSLAVMAFSGWPAFYCSNRMGRDGAFRMWKLRTMVRDADRILEQWKHARPDLAADYEQDFKLADDPRVTRLGRLLRRTSLDELPQLWNVLRGEMSLVGPRPINRIELAKYGERAPDLLSVRPGLTGRWQVTGRNSITYPERTSVELNYVRELSFAEDCRLLRRTIAALFRSEGV
jgi:lipopolysaccharide/colanic/teichoic acid biosynthesis glycosyltransferase